MPKNLGLIIEVKLKNEAQALDENTVFIKLF
jgi:hypothetical protein